MKKIALVGMGIGIAIVVILSLSWFVGNNVEKASSSITNSSNLIVSTSPPIGKTYHLNFSESIGIKAQP